MKKIFILLSGMLFLSQFSHAETDQELMDAGQWRDPQTGLIWMRCSIGQTWTGETCTGQVKKMELSREVEPFLATLNKSGGFAGHQDWRLPTIVELAAIRQCTTGWQADVIGQKATVQGTMEDIKGGIRFVPFTTMKNSFDGEVLDTSKKIPLSCAKNEEQPTLDRHIFPNTLAYKYWTQSRGINMNDNKPIYVDFHNGYIDSQDWSYMNGVRLVRGKKIDFSTNMIQNSNTNQNTTSNVINTIFKILSQ